MSFEGGETLADLARHLGVDRATIQREVERLERVGILVSERVGRARVVRANRAAPIYSELAALLRKAFGPKPLLEAALADVDGVRSASIFGSWAERYAGEIGPLPRDIDLVVVGDADPGDVYRAVRPVERELGLEVNPVVVTEEEWDHDPAGLVHRIREGPLVELDLADGDR